MEALNGLKVIELGQFVAGPFAAKTLADFGADVIKVESAGAGDGLRKWRIVQDGTSLWWEIQSRNKRSVCLDLKSPEGRDVILELAKEADVVIENFKPGTLEKWGLGWEVLHEINPKLVMLRISGFGQTGPYKDKPGFGVLGESMGGLRYITGEPGRVPVRTGISIGDTLASMHGVMGLMFALHHVNVHGGDGQVVDVALYESVFNVMESTLTEYTSAGVVRERTGSALPGIVPTNAYLCKDDQYVLIAGNGDSIFQRLMTEMGRQDLADDPELKHNDGRSRQVERSYSGMGRNHDLRRSYRTARCRLRACGQDLYHRRHRRRPAVSGPRHDPGYDDLHRQAHEDPGHRSEDERHAGPGEVSGTDPGSAYG